MISSDTYMTHTFQLFETIKTGKRRNSRRMKVHVVQGSTGYPTILPPPLTFLNWPASELMGMICSLYRRYLRSYFSPHWSFPLHLVLLQILYSPISLKALFWTNWFKKRKNKKQSHILNMSERWYVMTYSVYDLISYMFAS